MSSKQTPVTKLGGVITGKSPYEVEDGCLHLASRNVVMREEGRLEQRRGITRLFLASRYDKLIPYAGALIAHQLAPDGTNVVRINSPFGGPPASIGSASNPATRKIQAQAAGDRLFMTTAAGLQVLDSLVASLRAAGGPIAPSFRHTTSSTGGFLATGNQCAYRYTLGRLTSTGTQIIGPPSGRRLVLNLGLYALEAPNLEFVVPPGLDDSYFIQIWRSGQVAQGIEPDDDLRLVYERAITQAEATAKKVSLIDVTPEALRGDYLYTNPNSGEGIQQANHPPPLAEEVVLHKDRLWLGRTTSRWQYEFQLLAVGGTNGLVATDKILITSQSPALEITEGVDFNVYTAGSASQNVRITAENIVQGINLSANNTTVWAEYISGPDDVPGKIRIYERTVNTTGVFQLYVAQRTGGAAWTARSAYVPELLPYLPNTVGTPIAFSLQRAANVVTATINSGNLTNALRVGDRVELGNGDASFPSGAKVVTAITATTFTYAEVGANVGVTPATYKFTMYEDGIAQATRDEKINRIHFSKPFEFEAFPTDDYVDIGASDKGIIAMRVTRETLWVFKEDGLFRITGEDVDQFDWDRLDATVVAVTPECVLPFAESIVAWTTRGVFLISESTFELISGDVDSTLQDILASEATSGTVLDGRIDEAFMVVDEREGIVRLHLPGTSKTNQAANLGCGEAFVYVVKTRKWFRWVWANAADKRVEYKPFLHGVLEPTTRRVMYVDGYSAAGEGRLWKERSTADAELFVDEDYVGGQLAVERRAIWLTHEEAPMRDKRWDEISVLFSRERVKQAPAMPGAFYYGFGNENDESDNSEIIFGLPAIYFINFEFYLSETPTGPVVRIGVPNDQTRGQRLWIAVMSNTMNTDFVIEGFAVQAEVLNEAIGR